MKQTFQALAVLFSLALALPVAALGLGKLEHDSALNERFEARLPLLSATADELSSLKIGLADEAAFRRANVSYSPVLGQLRFKLVEPQSGNEYIHITSDQPISEPFLNFLVELSWGSGRIYREYTVLLDPPLYDSNRTRTAASDRRTAPSTTEPATKSPAPEKYSHTVNYPDQQPVRPASPSARVSAYNGGDYGPVQSGATLWSIASEMRPGGVTTQQMMLALLRTNPDAFIGNNINALKRGAILRMPDAEQLNAINATQALAEVENQHALWEQVSQSVAASPAQRADSVTSAASQLSAENETTAASADESASASESESRLQLVAAEKGNADQQAGDGSGANEDLSQQLAIVNEQLESVQQQNADLQDRLSENEALIEDLKRLIALKDDELASLQDGSMQDSAAVSEEDGRSASTPLQQDGHTVNYPNGDPAQFLNVDPGPEGTAPLAAESAPAELSHTVNYPNGEPQAEAEAPAAETITDTDAAAEATAAGSETATAELPAESDMSETTGLQGGIMATLADMAGTVRAFVMNNLMIVGAALLALIALLAGISFMRRRQAADSDDAVMTSAGFIPFTASSDLEETTFDNDSDSATEFNVALDEDETPPALSAGVASSGDDADLFVVPEGEGPQAVIDQEEEDPLAEVNVLMAYEHFDQAETFVRNALKSEPDNVEYHAKLLEVFYAAGNKKKYEEAASDLRDLTGGRGEQWDMAVAMWQEMSPNRALFEAGDERDEDKDELGSSTGGGGIVDITSDTATAGSGTSGGDNTGIDFDLGDSTGGGKHVADDVGEMLDLTASQDENEGGMLDLTAASNQDDEQSDMLDLTSSTGSMDALDDTRTMTQSELGQGSTGGQPDADNSLDFSLDGVGGSDLLDVSHSGEVDSDEDLLDLTSSGKKAEQEDGLDFSLDDLDEVDSDSTEAAATETSDDDDLLEFTTDMPDDSSVDLGFETEATDESASDSNFDSLDLQIESYDDSADLDEIGEELDRLEQTLGTLSRQDTTKSGFSSTSDALDGIDNALEELGNEQEAADSELEDIESEFELSLDDDEEGTNDSVDDDLSALSLELDSDDSEVSLDSLDSAGAEINLESTGDGEALDFDLDNSDDLEIDLDDNPASADAELADDDFSLDTVQMDAVKTEDPSEHGFDLDFDLDSENDDSLANIDMDSTVELPKHRLGNGLSLDESDEDEDENTLFVPRSGNTNEQSLEDELTTKLDLAKAYVELGDSESARSILEEVMQDGNDNQQRQAEELLQQL